METKIGVSQKAIIVNEDGKILTMRRTETAPTTPLHWDLPGGDLELFEDPKEGILREIKEEVGLEVEDLKVMDVLSSSRDKEEFWVTPCYTAKPKSKDVVLSYEHDDFKWVTPDEYISMKVSPKNKRFMEIFKSLQNKI